MDIPGVYLANKVYAALVKVSPNKPKVKAIPTIHVSEPASHWQVIQYEMSIHVWVLVSQWQGLSSPEFSVKSEKESGLFVVAD